MKNQLSVCMISNNDEVYIGESIQYIKDLVDEVIVVDLGSTDQTIEIAKKEGAIVYSFPWNNSFSEVKNFCMEKATSRWVLFLQPYERIEREQFQTIREMIKNPNVEAYLLYINYGLTEYVIYSPTVMLRLLRKREEYQYEYQSFEYISEQYLYNIEDIDVQIINKKVDSFPWDLSLRVTLLENEVIQKPEDSYVQYMYGVWLLNNGKIQESKVHFEIALKTLDRETIYQPHLYKCLALTYLMTEQVEEAMKLLSRGIEEYPFYTDFFIFRSEIYKERNQHEEALADLLCGLEKRERPSYLIPGPELDVSVILEKIGDLYEEELEYMQAMECYKEGYENNKGNSILGCKLYNMATILPLESLENYKDARLEWNLEEETYFIQICLQGLEKDDLSSTLLMLESLPETIEKVAFYKQVLRILLVMEKLELYESLTSAVQLEGVELSSYMEKAEDRLQLKQLIGEISSIPLDKELENTTEAKYHYEKGVYFGKKGKQLASLFGYVRSALCNPFYPEPIYKLCELYEKDSQWFQVSLQNDYFGFNQKEDTIQFLFGILAFFQRDFEKAQELFQTIQKGFVYEKQLDIYQLSCQWKEGLEIEKEALVANIEGLSEFYQLSIL